MERKRSAVSGNISVVFFLFVFSFLAGFLKLGPVHTPRHPGRGGRQSESPALPLQLVLKFLEEVLSGGTV
jgi:hypothetical protein